MTIKIMYSCILSGKDINTRKISSNPFIEIINSSNIGKEIACGRFKSRIGNEGYIHFNNYLGDYGDFLSFQKFLDLLLTAEIHNEIQKSEYADLQVTLFYQEQCNWELTIDDLAKLNSIGVGLSISACLQEN